MVIVEWDTNGPYPDSPNDPVIVDVYAVSEDGKISVTTEFCEDSKDVAEFLDFTLSNPEFWDPTRSY